jgi:hypothetical protein
MGPRLNFQTLRRITLIADGQQVDPILSQSKARAMLAHWFSAALENGQLQQVADQMATASGYSHNSGEYRDIASGEYFSFLHGEAHRFKYTN